MDRGGEQAALRRGLGRVGDRVGAGWGARPASTGSTVHIRGVAKEGLIKQHAGRGAANRVAAALIRSEL